MADENRPDLLYGYAEIAEHLGRTPRQVKHLAEAEGSTFPTFKLPGGRTVCALRSRLDAWLVDQSARKAVEGGEDE